MPPGWAEEALKRCSGLCTSYREACCLGNWGSVQRPDIFLRNPLCGSSFNISLRLLSERHPSLVHGSTPPSLIHSSLSLSLSPSLHPHPSLLPSPSPVLPLSQKTDLRLSLTLSPVQKVALVSDASPSSRAVQGTHALAHARSSLILGSLSPDFCSLKSSVP